MVERIIDLKMEKEFSRLAKRWHNETSHHSSLNIITRHPDYQAIIEMGEPILPLIFKELLESNDHWSYALSLITGDDPARGSKTYQQGVGEWLDWGVAHGYLPAETRKDSMSFYSVDGLSFTIQDGWIEATGWQGRHLEFPEDNLELVQKVIKSVPEVLKKDYKRVKKGSFYVKKSEKITQRFNIFQQNGWTKVSDDINLMSLEFSIEDREALDHILGEVKKLQNIGNTRNSHFCEKYGVEDDD